MKTFPPHALGCACGRYMVTDRKSILVIVNAEGEQENHRHGTACFTVCKDPNCDREGRHYHNVKLPPPLEDRVRYLEVVVADLLKGRGG